MHHTHGRDSTRFQTSWKVNKHWTFYANISSSIRSRKVISDAKKIVDQIKPQKFLPYGGTHFYFLSREYFLNLLLFYYEDHKCFPKGEICLVGEEHWRNLYFQNQRKLFGNLFESCRNENKKYRTYSRPQWFSIPEKVKNDEF